MSLTEVLDPTGADGRIPEGTTSVSLDALAGSTIGIRHDKLWVSFDWVTDEWAQALRDRGADVVLWSSDERTGKEGEDVTRRFGEFVSSVQATVTGLASCGSCTMLTIKDAVTAADRGQPAVAVCTEQFEALARMLATREGRPGLPLVVLPFPLETRPEDEVREIARAAVPQLLAALGTAGS